MITAVLLASATMAFFIPRRLKRSFIRRLEKATGMKPLDYVHALRLEEAKQMLETTDLPIEAIANEAGMRTRIFFGRLFPPQDRFDPGPLSVAFWCLAPGIEAQLERDAF